ncbi:hypothetical protein Lfu02_49110 [Longispora fulva]|uniref:Uncharacterized protein n=1 Tax=Longispora fulva TaxID=619741 RepID=A0A8J7GCZ7_9ACTN|nr:hypothetical protein [Longispora fulva]MBG6138288.1 hypothetical protein [Longispora fulva]GIG60539.1 hypothetical protein Lfu02_49110 [Longispora fulva]
MRERLTNGWTMGFVACGLAVVVIAAIFAGTTLRPDPPRGLAAVNTTITAYRTNSPEWQSFATRYQTMGGLAMTTPESDVIVVAVWWGKGAGRTLKPATDSCARPYTLPVPPGWQPRGFATTGDARQTAIARDRIDLTLDGYPDHTAYLVFGVAPGTLPPSPAAQSSVRC